jgi:23S rRNA pseudouridine1911/1915/1917 synthase
VTGPPSTEVVVPALLSGVRVDRAVAMVADVSRAEAATLVATGGVAVDGRVVTSRSTLLTEGAVLRITLAEPPGALAPEPEVDVPVVHADADIVVVDKPAGMVMHPGAGRRTGTLVAGLLARFPDLGALAEDGTCASERPGVVQRLDKGTSGLVVVARRAPAYRSLVEQLGARTVERRYVAMVAGHVSDDRGMIDAPIGRSTRTPTRMTVSRTGREARTSYEVLGRLDGPSPSTLVAVALETGRTHQIRVHMAAIGHPVLGDDRYGPPGGTRRAPRPAALAPGRLFLHAAVLGFVHPTTGSTVRWQAALPADLADLTGGLVVPDLLGPGGT